MLLNIIGSILLAFSFTADEKPVNQEKQIAYASVNIVAMDIPGQY